eukprot:7389447-Prymnesium_polylepis.1
MEPVPGRLQLFLVTLPTLALANAAASAKPSHGGGAAEALAAGRNRGPLPPSSSIRRSLCSNRRRAVAPRPL